VGKIEKAAACLVHQVAIRQAMAIKIKDTGITKQRATRPFADKVKVRKRSSNSGSGMTRASKQQNLFVVGWLFHFGGTIVVTSFRSAVKHIFSTQMCHCATH